MNSARLISILLVFPGSLFMFASLVTCVAMSRGVPLDLRGKWRAMIFLILFFMTGYIFFLVVQVQRLVFPMELITSTVFFGGAIFVFLVMGLTRRTIAEVRESEARVNEANAILVEKNRELEQEVSAREEAEGLARRRLQHLSALHTIDLMITSSLDLKVTMSVFLEQILPHLEVDAATVLLLNPHTQTLEYAAGCGFRSASSPDKEIRVGAGPAGTAALERKLIQVEDLQEHAFDSTTKRVIEEEGFRGYCAVPLIAKGVVKGVLEIFRRSKPIMLPERIEFLEALAVQAAIAIDNATLFDELQRTNAELIIAYDSTIEGWGHALELRDRETEGHTRRVTDITVRIARVYGLSEKEIVHVRRGALLHDIGKMGIPDAILMKDGPLTPEEEQIMRNHPVYAFEMLSPITYLRPALDIPYCHHEKWDGTGYPRGLRGEQIPLAARIFALADIWDALISERRYHEAWPREKVEIFIREKAGTHFDPDLVELFLANV